MVFKKKKISNGKKPGFLSYLVGILGVFVVFSAGAFLQNKVTDIKFFIYQDIGDITRNTFGSLDDNITSTFDKEKDKINNKINLLLVGRGGGNHDAPDLTDTIIVSQIDIKKNLISLLSIPRDLYVEYYDGGSGKINEIYRLDMKRLGTKDLGMKSLMNKVGEIIGEEINYYVNIDFQGFIKLIDAFGGVEVEVPENFVDYRFPDGKLGYTTFVLRKGKWVLDGEIALKYARSRHSTSDFDRSVRQQQILKSLKNKISNNGFLENASKFREMYDLSNKYLDTNLDFNTILKLGFFGNKTKDLKILSFNFNDSCFYGSLNCQTGGFLYVPLRDLFGGLSVLLPNGVTKMDLNNYSDIHKFTNIIFRRPEVFLENYKINVYNGAGVNNLASEISSDIKKYGFNIPDEKSIGNAGRIYEKSVILYNGIEDNSKTIQELKKFFNGEYKKVEERKFSLDEEVKIEIVIGKDYKKVFLF
ncbi:hypothetical protein CSA08_01940 [Candidatus Gracilibacteria bacterium]|nr:MAG: hypothetical protein CSA08_01940 [Candidatus Gracilibacteria bacterium]